MLLAVDGEVRVYAGPARQHELDHTDHTYRTRSGIDDISALKRLLIDESVRGRVGSDTKMTFPSKNHTVVFLPNLRVVLRPRPF